MHGKRARRSNMYRYSIKVGFLSACTGVGAALGRVLAWCAKNIPHTIYAHLFSIRTSPPLRPPTPLNDSEVRHCEKMPRNLIQFAHHINTWILSFATRLSGRGCSHENDLCLSNKCGLYAQKNGTVHCRQP